MTSSIRRSAAIWLAGLLLLSAARVQAEDGDDLAPPSCNVRDIIAAAAAQDQAALKRLAESDACDPWYAAHELCVRGHRTAARALAQATDRKDLAGLKAYVATLSRSPPRRDVFLMYLQTVTLAEEERWRDLRAFSERRVDLAGQGVIEASYQYVLGFALMKLERTVAAREHLEKAGDLALRLGWWRGAQQYWSLYFDIARDGRDVRAMLVSNRKLLEIFQFQGDRAKIGTTLSDMGSILGNLGNYGGALQHFTQAVEEYGDAMSVPSRLHTVVGIGMVHARMGHYADAESRYRNALSDVAAHAHALRAQDPVDHAQLHLLTSVETLATEHLGTLSTEIGAYDKAAELLQRARALTVALGDEQWEAEIRGNLANVAMLQGKHDEALREYRELVDYYEQTGQVDYALSAKAGIAEIEREQGKLDQALRRQKAVLRARKVRDLPSDLAASYNELARLHAMMGQHEQALDYRERQLALARQMADLDEEVEAMAGLAKSHNALKDHRKALEIAREAAGRLSYVFDRLSPMRAATARGKTADVYRAGLEAALALGSVEDVSHFLEGERAGALLVALDGGDRIRTATIPAGLRKQATDARMAEALAHGELTEVRKSSGLRKTAQANQRYETARAVHRVAVDRILLESSIAADLVYPSPAGLAEIQGVLADDEALVVYGMANRRLIALRITRHAAKIFDLAAAPDVHAACVALRAEVGERKDMDASALREHLVEPLGLTAGIRRVLVSPVACLAYVPMGLVFLEREVALVQSGTTLVKLSTLPTVANGPVLALGDPHYGGAPQGWAGAPAVRGGRLSPLPGTRKEAKAIGDRVLLGDDASETRLRSEIAKLVVKDPLRCLHLACHGLVDEERPNDSALALTPSAEDDGLLTTSDVFQMKVPADLVVLSACDTGRGKLMHAEGIFGLTRAFMAAGSKRVLVSLWKVDDEASRALMIRFHELWNAKDPAKRMSATAALRAAQRYVRTHPDHPAWKHPYYWAAWQLWGPPR